MRRTPTSEGAGEEMTNQRPQRWRPVATSPGSTVSAACALFALSTYLVWRLAGTLVAAVVLAVVVAGALSFAYLRDGGGEPR